MDDYTGFAEWGLLWVMVGVFVWLFIRSMLRPKLLSRAVTEPENPLVQAEQAGPPKLFDGSVSPNLGRR